jgi:hypothetical protein
MAATLGNQFWKLRLKHGTDFKIDTSSQLLHFFYEYAQWCIDNPLIEIDFKGKDAKEVEIPKMRPFTKDAFSLFCGLSGWEVIDSYKKRDKDFFEVITRIEKAINIQKFEGAAAGLLNPNIIARDLGLVDRVDQNTTHEYKNLPPWMTKDESELEAPDT